MAAIATPGAWGPRPIGPARPARRPPVGVVAAAIALAGVVPAAAASLGSVTAASLSASTQGASTGAPTVLVWENFNGTNATAISGTTTDGGAKTWSQFGGTWTISSNQAKSTSASPSGLICNVGVWNAAAEATITHGSGQWNGNVIINASSSGSDQIEVDFTKGSQLTLTLYKRVSGTFTQLATLTGQTAPTSGKVRLESRSNGVVNLYVDGTLKLTYTLTAGEQSTFFNGTHTYFGIGTYADATTTIDDFHVDQ